MSSILRAYPQRKEGLTRFLKPETPAYSDNNSIIRPFPFSYSNGMLDITYSGNNFKSIMVDVLNVAPDDECDVGVSVFGSPVLVTSLGNNFKDYIRSWQDGTIDAGSPINLYQPSQIFRVQVADAHNVDSSSAYSWILSGKPPVSDYYTAGAMNNNYDTTYLFKTPLTFTIQVSGVTQYITFETSLDQE